jgi:hypothetical protein
MMPTRLLAALGLLVALPGCTGGINAGEQGGMAFVAFTVFLLITIAILYFAIGRND